MQTTFYWHHAGHWRFDERTTDSHGGSIDTYTLLGAGIFKAFPLDVSDFLRRTVFATSTIS